MNFSKMSADISYAQVTWYWTDSDEWVHYEASLLEKKYEKKLETMVKWVRNLLF